MANRRANPPKSRSNTYNRWGDLIARGAVVTFHGGGKGVVLRLEPLDNFSRAYGRQAVVQTYGKRGDVHESSHGISDMKVVGWVKRVPEVADVGYPPRAEEIAYRVKGRDIRREGQGAGYDPNAVYNRTAEDIYTGTTGRIVTRRLLKKSRRR